MKEQEATTEGHGAHASAHMPIDRLTRVIAGFSLAFLGVGAFGVFVIVRTYDNRLGTLEESVNRALSESHTQLAQMQESYLDIREDIARMQIALAESDSESGTARQEAERALDELSRERVALRSELGAIAGQVSAQEEELSRPRAGELIAAWSPRIARIVCTFPMSGNRTGRSTGSAVATLAGGMPSFVTNAHIIDLTLDVKPTSCALTLPDRKVTITVSGDSIVLDAARDVAWIPVPTADRQKVGITSAVNTCTTKPALGDELFILGYPSTGSIDSVTATDGIISGFDDGLYVTSAKIERGNSGGAAIHIRENCFLGIPTLAVVGTVESLARILPL